jgi:hypothetical protein
MHSAGVDVNAFLYRSSAPDLQDVVPHPLALVIVLFLLYFFCF